MNLAADDPEGQARNTAFVQALQQLGWTSGRNAHIDTRWGTDAGSNRKYAAELVALAPDVILASASSATSALQQTTRTVPIVCNLAGACALISCGPDCTVTGEGIAANGAFARRDFANPRHTDRR
jgi:hypothetical protein